MSEPKMAVEIADIWLKNPVMNASGTMGYGEEYKDFVDIGEMGAFVPKGLTLEPRKGSEPPRIIETPCGVINRIGLENVGVERFIEEKLPYLRQFDTPIIVNINGETVDEYRECAYLLKDVEGIAALEVNLGCPNMERGGAEFGKDKQTVTNVVRPVWELTRVPLIVKLTPDVTSIAEIAKAVEGAGANAISLINTTKGAAIIDGKLFVGGLSGPAIKPRALYLVSEVVKAVKIPVIGIGGIMTAEDALDLLGVGGRAVQVGTANFFNHRAIPEIIQGIREFMAGNHIADINNFIGSYV